MSFSLPQAGALTHTSERKGFFVVEKDHSSVINCSLFAYEKNQLEDIIKKQQERICALGTSIKVDLENDERLSRAHLFKEKKALELDLAKLTGMLATISADLQKLRQEKYRKLQLGKMWADLAGATSAVDALKAEVFETEKQIEVTQTLTVSQRERLNTVRRELRQAQQQVKWMLECQVLDERAYANRIMEEEKYLRQLLRARDATKRERFALLCGGLEVLPLQDEVRTLQAYLKEMRGYTKVLQVSCQELYNEVENARDMELELSAGNAAVFRGYRRALDYVDQELFSSLNAQLQTSCRHNLPPLSTTGNDNQQWMLNSLAIWQETFQHCSRLLEAAKQGSGSALREKLKEIRMAEERLSEIMPNDGGDANEREIAFLFIENLLDLQRKQQKTEEQLIQLVRDAALANDEPPESYISLVKADGFDDIIEDDNANEESLAAKESFEGLFKEILLESPEKIIEDIQSVAGAFNDVAERNQIARRTAHRSQGLLFAFLEQLLLFMRQEATQEHLPLRPNMYKGSPTTVEEFVSQFQEKLINDTLCFVKRIQNTGA